MKYWCQCDWGASDWSHWGGSHTENCINAYTDFTNVTNNETEPFPFKDPYEVPVPNAYDRPITDTYEKLVTDPIEEPFVQSLEELFTEPQEELNHRQGIYITSSSFSLCRTQSRETSHIPPSVLGNRLSWVRYISPHSQWGAKYDPQKTVSHRRWMTHSWCYYYHLLPQRSPNNESQCYLKTLMNDWMMQWTWNNDVTYWHLYTYIKSTSILWQL